MLLAMDVGNSNIKVGLFEGEKLISSFRITTNADRSSDEYGLLIIHFLSYLNRTADEIEGVIIATVQPQLRYTLDRMTHTFFRCHPMFDTYQLMIRCRPWGRIALPMPWQGTNCMEETVRALRWISVQPPPLASLVRMVYFWAVPLPQASAAPAKR